MENKILKRATTIRYKNGSGPKWCYSGDIPKNFLSSRLTAEIPHLGRTKDDSEGSLTAGK